MIIRQKRTQRKIAASQSSYKIAAKQL